MRSILIKNLIAILAIFCLSGCAIRSVYIPLSQNVPLFDSDKQVKASGYLGTNHVELQAVHNPVAHLAVATNVYFGTGISSYDAALGTYGFDKNAKWRYELFAGYGYTSNISLNNSDIISASEKLYYNVNALYHRVYIQPAAGFYGKISIYKIKYSFSLSAKISYLYFKDYLFEEVNEAQPTPIYVLHKEYRNAALYTFEPCLINKVGIKNVAAILQVQTISPYSQQINVSNTKFSPDVIFAGGIQYTLNFKNRKK